MEHRGVNLQIARRTLPYSGGVLGAQINTNEPSDKYDYRKVRFIPARKGK